MLTVSLTRNDGDIPPEFGQIGWTISMGFSERFQMFQYDHKEGPYYLTLLGVLFIFHRGRMNGQMLFCD